MSLMKIAKRGLAALAITLTGAGVMISGAGTAAASAYSCDFGDYCVYKHVRGSDPNHEMWASPRTVGDYRSYRFSMGSGLDNQVSGWYNNGYFGGYDMIRSYAGFNGAGGQLWAGRPARGQDWVGWAANDKASSHRWTNG
jgi:hypothetical protein